MNVRRYVRVLAPVLLAVGLLVGLFPAAAGAATLKGSPGILSPGSTFGQDACRFTGSWTQATAPPAHAATITGYASTGGFPQCDFRVTVYCLNFSTGHNRWADWVPTGGAYTRIPTASGSITATIQSNACGEAGDIIGNVVVSVRAAPISLPGNMCWNQNSLNNLYNRTDVPCYP